MCFSIIIASLQGFFSEITVYFICIVVLLTTVMRIIWNTKVFKCVDRSFQRVGVRVKIFWKKVYRDMRALLSKTKKFPYKYTISIIFTFKTPGKYIFWASKKKSGSYKFQNLKFPIHSGLTYYGFSKQQLL